MMHRATEVSHEFLYLCLLARDRLKPVSRWEDRFGERELGWLKRFGLNWRTVERKTRFRRRRWELVFGRSARWVDFYAQKFSGAPIQKTHQLARLEGQLFGYPSCCVENFVENGYAPNHLPPADQRILFHWACPNCRVTPSLVPAYRERYAEASHLVRRPGHDWRSGRQRLFPFAAAASLLFFASRGLSQTPDPHVFPFPDALDTNHNGLLDRYEEALTSPPLVSSGRELAAAILRVLEDLPEQPQEDRPYKSEFLAYGLETCSVCGSTVNMGFLRIVNPTLRDSVDLPFIAIHALGHGSLDYTGSLHWGRVHLLRLLRVLGMPYTTHALPLGYELDADGDGLLDAAEKRLGLSSRLVDADSNRIVDGPQLAVDWAAEIRALPTPTEPVSDRVYRVDHPMRGLETCEVCDTTVNMGYLEIVNPLENFKIELPYVALHALEHGSFVYAGSIHGRAPVLPRALQCALHADGSFHQLPVEGDSDNDGLTDAEEKALGSNPNLVDSDGDGVPDGRALAWRLAEALEKLPKKPRPDGPYLRDFAQKGLEICDVCGRSVNMGYVRIVSPQMNDSLDVPYVAWHAMRHGAFTAQGTLHKFRVDPVHLSRLLGVRMDVHGGGTEAPQNYGLLEAYPNPFGRETQFRVVLRKELSPVEIEIFDLLARRVRILRAPVDVPGMSQVVWDGRDDRGRSLPSGLYFCRVKGEFGIPPQKVMLLR